MEKQEVIIISALAKNRTIGLDGKIPWHIKEDFELFKKHTTNNIVIMGKNTWDSLPEKFRPLPDRINIVLCEEQNDEFPAWADSIDSALTYSKIVAPEKKIFLIGGARVYNEGVEKYANKMYLSHLNKEYKGDTFFPEFNENDWKIEKEEKFEEFTFKIWKKN